MKTVIAILNRALPLSAGFDINIDNEPHMPLTIEGIGSGPRGQAAISVCHYANQNGDLMRDPEMCFEVEMRAGEVAELYPYYWRNDYSGIEQEAIVCEGTDPGGKAIVRVDTRMVTDHCEFALLWDRNLQAQGFEAAFLRSSFLTARPQSAKA